MVQPKPADFLYPERKLTKELARSIREGEQDLREVLGEMYGRTILPPGSAPVEPMAVPADDREIVVEGAQAVETPEEVAATSLHLTVCGKCKFLLRDSDKHCPECGVRLDWSKVSTLKSVASGGGGPASA